MYLSYFIWFRWLRCSLIISYHTCVYMSVQTMACLLVVSFVYWFMKSPDLTCICQGVEWQDLHSLQGHLERKLVLLDITGFT